MFVRLALVASIFRLEVPLPEKILRAALIYAFLVLALRLAGKRELAQLTSLDFVVLLAVANAVQNGIIGPDNSVTGAVVGAAVLFLLNGALALLLFRSARWRKLLEGSPSVLIRDGEVDHQALRHERMTEEDLLAAIEGQGATDFAEVQLAILEPNGAIVTILKVPNYETEHFDALSRQIAELRSLIESEVSTSGTAADPRRVSERAGDIARSQ